MGVFVRVRDRAGAVLVGRMEDRGRFLSPDGRHCSKSVFHFPGYGEIVSLFPLAIEARALDVSQARMTVDIATLAAHGLEFDGVVEEP